MPAEHEFLTRVAIFSMLTPGEMEKISRILRRATVDKGAVLFHQGDEGNELYIVESGAIGSSIKLPDGTDHEIAVFRSGEFFGEMSIFEQAPRSATCVAKEGCEVLSLEADEFFSFISDHPGIAIKVMYRMLNIVTQRLENTGGVLADMVTWGEKARKRAITDELTGVYNRRFLEDVIPDYFRNAEKAKSPLTVVMVDLDRFREINEEYGNKMGDRAILEVVSVFKNHLAESHIIARYGGDEFTVMLPDTNLAQAQEITWAICRDVRGLTFLKEAGGIIQQITTSQGLASYPECANDLKSLRNAADEALYKAKHDGKNRVESASTLNGAGAQP